MVLGEDDLRDQMGRMEHELMDAHDDLKDVRAHVGMLREALNVAHHELTTLHGLFAFDGAAPQETWQIQTDQTLRQIDTALGREVNHD